MEGRFCNQWKAGTRAHTHTHTHTHHSHSLTRPHALTSKGSTLMYSGQEWSVGQKVLRVSENGSVYLVPIRMVFTDGSNWRTCQESQDREDGGITNQHTCTASWPTYKRV